MQIINNIRNDLLKRNEVICLVESEKNPSFNEMKKQVSEQVGKPEENIDVYNIKGSFGSKEFKINSNVYDSKEDLEKSKMKTKKQRDAEKKSSKEEAKATESAPVEGEAPAEDKPEEKSVVTEGAESLAKEVKTEEKPSEGASEDKPEEEAKAAKEEEQSKEEVKEN